MYAARVESPGYPLSSPLFQRVDDVAAQSGRRMTRSTGPQQAVIPRPPTRHPTGGSFPIHFEGCQTDLRRTPDLSEDLLPRVAAGDPQAIQGCIDRYGALIWSLARRHSPSPADAEDAVQEIYIDLWKSSERFDSNKASETTFVAMIARRRLIDRHRHRQRRPQTDALDPARDDVVDPNQKQMEASAEASLAARALATLAPQEQRVILLSTYQGMSHGQISDHTGIPLGTVKTYIRRGLQRVRKLLERDPSSLEEVGS